MVCCIRVLIHSMLAVPSLSLSLGAVVIYVIAQMVLVRRKSVAVVDVPDPGIVNDTSSTRITHAKGGTLRQRRRQFTRASFRQRGG